MKYISDQAKVRKYSRLQKWRAENVKHIADYDVKYRDSHWVEYLLRLAKHRAKIRNYPFMITSGDIGDPKKSVCPAFGTAFIHGSRVKLDASATIDCIHPSMGYVPGNVWLVSSLMNDIKNEASYDIIRMVGLSLSLEEKREIQSRIIYNICEDTRLERQYRVRNKRKHNKLHHGLAFTIEWYNLSFPKYCPCLGIEIDYENKLGNWKNLASIDRIDNSIGYVPGNVWIISKFANTIKATASSSQILRVADTLEAKVKSLGHSEI